MERGKVFFEGGGLGCFFLGGGGKGSGVGGGCLPVWVFFFLCLLRGVVGFIEGFYEGGYSCCFLFLGWVSVGVWSVDWSWRPFLCGCVGGGRKIGRFREGPFLLACLVLCFAGGDVICL